MTQRLRIDYGAITVEEANDLLHTLRANHTVSTRGCMLFNGSVNTDGYAQVQRKNFHGSGKKRNLLGHLLAIRASGRAAPGPKEQGSHLCHVRNCFEPSHLVVETIMLNNQRKGCPGDVVCAHCDMLVRPCPPCTQVYFFVSNKTLFPFHLFPNPAFV